MCGGVPDTNGTIREDLPKYMEDLSARTTEGGLFDGGFNQVLL